MIFADELHPQPVDMVGVDIREAGKVTLKLKAGASKSADRTYADIEQVVDRKNKRYKKRVVLADGTVVKDVEGPLKDQSLHGPQAQPTVPPDVPAAAPRRQGRE